MTDYSEKYPKGVHELGNQNEEAASWISVNQIIGIKASCPEAGEAQSISAYIFDHDVIGKKCKFALYRVSDGKLIGYTEEYVTKGIDTVDWVTLEIVWGGELEATDYYVVFWIQSGTDMRFYYGSGIAYYEEVAYNGFPDTFTPVTVSIYFSVYCTYRTPAYKNKHASQSTEYSNKY